MRGKRAKTLRTTERPNPGRWPRKTYSYPPTVGTTALGTPCREWQGLRTPDGYGRRWDRGHHRDVRVHRWVWEQIHGPIPAGVLVLHRCDNPPCYRLDHLFLGTNAENMADKTVKGRARNGHDGRTTCAQGHPYDEKNTYHRPDGGRRCRACDRDRHQRKHGGSGKVKKNDKPK